MSAKKACFVFMLIAAGGAQAMLCLAEKNEPHSTQLCMLMHADLMLSFARYFAPHYQVLEQI